MICLFKQVFVYAIEHRFRFRLPSHHTVATRSNIFIRGEIPDILFLEFIALKRQAFLWLCVKYQTNIIKI